MKTKANSQHINESFSVKLIAMSSFNYISCCLHFQIDPVDRTTTPTSLSFQKTQRKNRHPQMDSPSAR
ncbi:hypothetical protein DERF_011423 [Dermatophagoides farinae]|uniref:Uncharacterized protein n=1 Tax=Dermatophagoides farinae TaxID=6954 RepID=A0A922HVD8_DERFA|nr:hypothetical protein DERF_011423 [Dermatophagoides farinae]